MRVLIAGFAVAAWVASSAQAAAQPVLLWEAAPPSCSTACTGQLLTVDLDTPSVLSAATIPAADGNRLGGTYVAPDGAFVAWLQRSPGAGLPATLALHSAVTRTTALASLPSEATAIIGHPRRTEIFVTDASGPIAVSLAGVRRLSGPACAGPLSAPIGISDDGSRVVYTCGFSSNPAITGYFVLDTDSGAIVATLPFTVDFPVLSRDGAEYYRVEGSAPSLLRRRSVTTDAVLAERELPIATGPPRLVDVDPRTGRVFVSGRISVAAAPTTEVYDGANLQLAGAVPFPGILQNGGVTGWAFDPLRPVAYATTVGIVNFTLREHGYHVVQTGNLAVSFTAKVTDVLVPSRRFLVPPRPAAPAGLAATVAGSTVQLSWSAGTSNAATLRYLVEVGTGPGLANITTFDVGLQTSLTVPGVPPGTYYVRVRAANVIGASAPSNETVVTVP